ncbi:unnamed protein product [Phytophthora fragariaefolia]|uniref:Unnamed protein product n=1 Tax=Phytophthora fragariaefolia TaxID=1490495 RepID=A0A9W6TVX3_9STRA|nr:unnamed protein product [Phytophthora fragariaefolia]
MGDNEFGQIGVKRCETSEENLIDAPVHVAAFGTDKSIKQIGCGDDFSMVLTSAGEVYSWGRGQLGQLGLGESQTGPLDTPTKIPDLPVIQKLAVGINQVFAIEFTDAALRDVQPPPPAAAAAAVLCRRVRNAERRERAGRAAARVDAAVAAGAAVLRRAVRARGRPAPQRHQRPAGRRFLHALAPGQGPSARGIHPLLGAGSVGRLAARLKLGGFESLRAQVWSIADTQRRSELSRSEFYVAMRLISLAQRGEQLSVHKFVQFAAVQYPLPVMEGVPPPQGMHPAGGMQQMQQPPQQPAPVQAQVQQQGFAAVHQQPQPGSGAAYAVTPDEKSKYDIVFQQYDTDHDGFLMGAEAVALFQMSGLDRNVRFDKILFCVFCSPDSDGVVEF